LSGRAQRVNEVMISALEGVQIEGSVLAVSAAPPVVAALEAAGLQVTLWSRWGGEALPSPGKFQRVCMRLPKGRQTLVAMLDVVASSLDDQGRLWLYGANDEGIRSAGKQLKEYFDHNESVDARRHCRVLSASGIRAPSKGVEAFYTKVEEQVAGRTVRFRTLPGVFAHGRLDGATRFLLEHLEVDEGADVLDFGCGAGVVAAWLGERSGSLVGVDLDSWAVLCAAEQPGEYLVGDGFSAVPGRSFGHIISNPPFHTGKDTDFRVMEKLISAAPAHLQRGGKLSMVCPRTAPVQRALDAAFTKVREVASNRQVRVWEAR